MMSAMMDEIGQTIYSVPHTNDPKCTQQAYEKCSGFYCPWLP